MSETESGARPAAGPGTGPQTGGVREVKSAARTVDLLEVLAARGDRPARLRELAEELGVPRSSMYALLKTLIDRGWVRTDATGSLYGIGIRALLTGTSYLDSDTRVGAVRPYLDEASDALGETIHLARLDGPDVVYLATRESHEYLRTFSRVGRRLPAHAGALGKALLAERPDAELPLPAGELARLTPNTRTDRAALAADLAAVRVRGYALDREEGVLGISGFGFALRYDSPARDAISCSVPVARLTEEHERQIVAVMREIRAKIESLAPRTKGAPDWR
ncbi:IclR family transcriptional regulator [Streptomyces sp. MS2.AVA.5]|uniref:IclR family transcriptional regulator n=1 Tax=Streptomyces achmelvichensis TaxID=3134111 RepID=A0ACC6PVF7_9ACTN